MRILHWTESFWPRLGGAEQFVRRLAAASVARGHACLVISDAASGLDAVDEIDGITVRRAPFQSALAQRDLPAVAALARQAAAIVDDFAPAVVHVHTSQPGAFFFLRAMKRRRIPAVYTTHDPCFASASPLLEALLASVDRIAAVSRFMAEEIVRRFPAAASRTRCIVHGLPPLGREPAPLPAPPPIVLGLGRLIEEKGFDVLLRAWPQVIAALPEARLLIAGDGPARPALERLAAELGVAARVEFVGALPGEEVPRLLDRVSLVAVPSRWLEPFGLVAFEAMAHGRPVVASRVGGLPEIVVDDETGRLVAPGSTDTIAAAVVAIGRDPGRARRMGERGRRRAAAFDWDRCVSAYENLYGEVINR